MSKNKANIAIGLGILSSYIASRKSGSSKISPEYSMDQEEESFIPFYIEFTQSYSDNTLGPFDIDLKKTIIFGPFKKSQADQQFLSLTLFLRDLTNNKPIPFSIETWQKNDFFRMLDKKYWNGSPLYEPYLHMTKLSTSEYIAVLDDKNSWDMDEMTNLSFELWTDNPLFQKVKDGFIWQGLEDKGKKIPLMSPVFFNMWDDYLLPQVKKSFRFPNYNNWVGYQK